MSTNCEYCGYRDNEVKAGGAIPEKGKKIVLKVEDEEDLSRDLLKVRERERCAHPNSRTLRLLTWTLRPTLIHSPKPAAWRSPRSTWSCNRVPWADDSLPWKDSCNKFTKN